MLTKNKVLFNFFADIGEKIVYGKRSQTDLVSKRGLENLKNDFYVTIEYGEGNSLQVTAYAYNGEPAKGKFTLPFTEDQMDSWIEDLYNAAANQGGRIPNELTKTIGENLFRAVFNGDVLNLYRRSLQERSNLRIILNLIPNKLKEWPWEYLFDGETRRGWVALENPICRVLHRRNINIPKPYDKKEPLRLWFLQGREQENLGEEEFGLIEEIAENKKIRLDFKKIYAGDFTELADRFKREGGRGKPHIIHFSMHGEAGRLIMWSKAQQVDMEQLRPILADFETLHLILLNLCDIGASEGEELCKAGVPKVIAMQFDISLYDKSNPFRSLFVPRFTKGFYESYFKSFSVEEALKAARRHVYGLGNMEWGTPVLLTALPETHKAYVKSEIKEEKGKIKELIVTIAKEKKDNSWTELRFRG